MTENIARQKATLENCFSRLRKTFSGYEHRPQQEAMARAVDRAFAGGGGLLVEAGTGVGKSFAYLIPAVLSGRRTTVSTATIALQAQLVEKDLEFLSGALGIDFSFGLLKGKGNYVCLRRFEEEDEDAPEWSGLRKWLEKTKTGEKDELGTVPKIWPIVAGDADDCGGGRCPKYGECFYYRRFNALKSVDVLVVNHHLLGYDAVCDFKLLPFHDQLVVDEAHELDGVLSSVWGSRITYFRIQWALSRIRSLRIQLDASHDEAVSAFFKGSGVGERPVCPIPDEIVEKLGRLHEKLKLGEIVGTAGKLLETADSAEEEEKIKRIRSAVVKLEDDIRAFLVRSDEDRVFFATGERGLLQLRSALVECGDAFGTLAGGYKGMVLTSATLTADGEFAYQKNRLGIPHWTDLALESPFDYRKQARIYVENRLPKPSRENEEEYRRGSVAVIGELIEASMGRTLVLFTSHDHLRYVAENLDTDYPLKVQGQESARRLIKWMMEADGAVLLATMSFWQGVDVPGEALSQVVIAKLPFVSPGDPVYDERSRRLGDRWFMDLALPSAILMLKQGFGRLIRSGRDYGVVAILDPRAAGGGYAGKILRSLPRAPVLRRISDVADFFDSIP